MARRCRRWSAAWRTGCPIRRRVRWRGGGSAGDPGVEEKIERAIAQHRLLRFAYLSPKHTDATPRIHTVQPWHRTFDTAARHFYLEAYMQEARTPEGVVRAGYWVRYRLGRILPDGMVILPEKFAPIPPKRPRHALEYLLSPQIARLGEISRHFDDLQVHETQADGWVRVTATTTDLFTALRQLLRYGPNCRVLGGPDARRQMEEIVRALARLYGVGGEEEG